MTFEILTIIAILLGPIFAVQAQAWLDRRRAKKERRLFIFRTLMATRAALVSYEHVNALNMISIDFYDNHEIITCFNNYIKFLNTRVQHPENISQEERTTNAMIWAEQQKDLLADLLQKIGKQLGYEFDIDPLKRGIYKPAAHGDLEDEQAELRKALIALTKGERSISVNTLYTKEQQELNKNLVGNLNEVFSGKQAILVKNDTQSK